MVEYLNLLGHRVMFYSNRDGYYEYLADAFPGAPLWICGFSENPIHAEWSFGNSIIEGSGRHRRRR